MESREAWPLYKSPGIFPPRHLRCTGLLRTHYLFCFCLYGAFLFLQPKSQHTKETFFTQKSFENKTSKFIFLNLKLKEIKYFHLESCYSKENTSLFLFLRVFQDGSPPQTGVESVFIQLTTRIGFFRTPETVCSMSEQETQDHHSTASKSI